MNLIEPAQIVKPDIGLAIQHIELLTGAADYPCDFRLLHDSQKGEFTPRNLFGTVEDLWPEIEAAQREGYGVFVVVNEGGQNDASISGTRALFIDGDDVPMPSRWHCPPSFIVKRSDIRWHAYWLVDGLPPDAFKPAQLRLAANYGTDPSVCNPSRVMRLAGTMHMKDPAAPQIVMLEEIMGRWAGPYAADNVLCGVATVPVKLAEKRRAAAGVEIDHPRHIERFTQHLGGLVARSEVAIEGQHGDARTLQVANVGLDLGCSPETVHRLMLDHFNDQCVPPWEVDDLAVKVINASKSRENDIGCDALPSSQDAFGHLASNVQAATSPVSSTAQGKASRFKPIRENEMDAIPPPIWLVDNLVEDRTICVVVGESGSFKTFILADLCFSVAAGVKTAFGTMPNRSGPVFYASLEGLANVMQERRQAWREGRSITGTFPFFAMPAPVLWSVAEQEEFVAQIDATGERPALIALETFTTMLDGKENDTESGALFAKFCRGLIERYGCAVVTVHHNSDKDGASKTGRGTSSIKGNCDSMILVEGDPVTRTADVSVLKHRSFAMSAKPWHLRGRPCGPALVFGLITPEEVRAAQIERDPYHPTHIGAALRNLGAVRPDKAVASRILASELVPTERHATVEERDAAIKSATNRINERAAFQPGEKKSLCAYAEKTDRGWYWSLPG